MMRRRDLLAAIIESEFVFLRMNVGREGFTFVNVTSAREEIERKYREEMDCIGDELTKAHVHRDALYIG